MPQLASSAAGYNARQQKLCNEILALDKTLRSVLVANRKRKVIASVHREGSAPPLTEEESEKSILQAIIRMSTRRMLEHKLGKTIYAFAMYEKVKRATVPLYLFEPRANDDDEYYYHHEDKGYIMMITFDIKADHEPIILDKILPLIKKTIK